MGSDPYDLTTTDDTDTGDWKIIMIGGVPYMYNVKMGPLSMQPLPSDYAPTQTPGTYGPFLPGT